MLFAWMLEKGERELEREDEEAHYFYLKLCLLSVSPTSFIWGRTPLYFSLSISSSMDESDF